MQVINGDRSGMPGTEARAIEWLRADTGPGIAVSGVHVAGRGGRGREVDLLVFTPSGPAVIEVKGLTQRVLSPVLHTAANRRWTVDGIEGDPVHVGQGDTSPFDQVSGRVFDVKNTLGPDARIDGAVLVMAHARTVLRIEQHGPAPFGLAVIAGNRDSDLLGWIHGRRTSSGWTAQRVAGALDLLGVTVPDLRELVAAGFVDDGTDSATATSYTAPAAPAGVAAMPSLLPASGTHAGGGASPRPPRARRRPAPRRRGKSLALGGLGVGAAVVGASALGLVVLAGLTIGGASSTDPSTTEPAPVPAGTSWTATEVFTPPAPTPPPPATACYPFQPDC
ncbi:nuclease-related domain-containing protein [Nocardia fluminea]|uniref:nuclease-related domain-containing protein n=1 Tax=Nocardia fluminea TaxID=134984 RepID=UPI003648C8D2